MSHGQFIFYTQPLEHATILKLSIEEIFNKNKNIRKGGLFFVALWRDFFMGYDMFHHTAKSKCNVMIYFQPKIVVIMKNFKFQRKC